MLSDKEKKAFQYYKECNEKDLENYEYLHEVSQKQAKYLEILLNLIEKQQKEIEELKDTRSIFNMGRRSYKNEIEGKIKAKIEEVKDGIYDAKIVLQTLLDKE